MKVGIIERVFFIQLFLLSVVLAGNGTIFEFESTGTRLVSSLRVLGSYSHNSTSVDERLSDIEEQISEIKNMYSGHPFILKGLNGILNNKVNMLTKEVQMEKKDNITFEREAKKVDKGLHRAIHISPFKYIKKFKSISTKKFERILKKYDLTAKNGGDLTEEQKKKKEVLSRVSRVVAATTIEAGLAQGVVDLCVTVTTSLCLVSASIGGLGFLIWLTIVYQALT
ncbi:irc18p [Saccharomyces arboricola H-6]|uniref:Irc18p n=1 Tax=Saccharomyces arboricola (strain H-6 / AS 2.3317 / CBS 10644) TaxID=1160507 RepID=J8Q0I2_SACAR|nr:irc18p [Saccharomyces arboricola H-6]